MLTMEQPDRVSALLIEWLESNTISFDELPCRGVDEWK